LVTDDETADPSVPHARSRGPGEGPSPGVVQVYAPEAPVMLARAVETRVVLGRDAECDIVLDDRRVSRRHAEIERVGAQWRISDLGSHNGTFVDGVRIDGRCEAQDSAVVAVGNSLFVLARDVRRSGGAVAVQAGVVIGPRLRGAWHAIGKLAATSNVLHLVGETGVGKELAARHYHAMRCPNAPFIAVNCATIPALLAERLLFGARRGAYSGADADREGYLLAANRGVLFLDEIGELPLEVQAKLLRAMETHEVTPLGDSRAHAVELSVCSATHVELRAAVAAGRFREDLYYRLATPAVELPPLRAHREEIPWLVDATLRAAGSVRAHASFVEAALVRPWPGNGRELVRCVTTAAGMAPHDAILKAEHMPEHAGRSIARASEPNAAPTTPAEAERAAICAALEAEGGNVSRAARALGLHRTQLRRWLERNDVDAERFRRRLPKR